MTAPRRITAHGGKATLWPHAVPWQGGRADAVGRIAGDDPAAVLAAVLRESTAPWLLGPMDGDTWHAYRLVTEGTGRPPFAMEPPSDPLLEAALLGAGFAPVLTYASALVPLPPPRTARLATPGLRLRQYDPGDAEAELRRMHAMALAAFVHAPLFTPIPFDAFAALYRPYLPVVRPELVFFAEAADGAPAGVLFGLPDLAASGAQPRTAVLKTYAALRPGAGALLAAAFHAAAHRLGFGAAIHALMHDGNASLRHSRLLGGEVFRRYALFGRRR